MITRFIILLIPVLCLSCGDSSVPTPDVASTPAYSVDYKFPECLPWLDGSDPTNIEKNLIDVLSGLGVQGLDGLEIQGLQGGRGFFWNSEVVDAYYIFTYSVTNEAGEELLGVSGITIDLSDCEFTLMASK